MSRSFKIYEHYPYRVTLGIINRFVLFEILALKYPQGIPAGISPEVLSIVPPDTSDLRAIQQYHPGFL